ncbi:MAG: lipocalin-like domain-containing protein [Chloroflexi bacterium]|nr:lipocalin-like domain-containing protein [Chloroflexota bacterium]
MLNLVGAWRLTSCYFVAPDTGDRVDVLGAEPFGRVVFEPSGRMVVLMTAAARSSSDMADLFKSMIAYTGQWSIDGEKLTTHVDAAWDPGWVGTPQIRYFTFDGHTLSIRTAPIEHPAFPGRKVTGYVNWEREDSRHDRG